MCSVYKMYFLCFILHFIVRLWYIRYPNEFLCPKNCWSSIGEVGVPLFPFETLDTVPKASQEIKEAEKEGKGNTRLHYNPVVITSYWSGIISWAAHIIVFVFCILNWMNNLKLIVLTVNEHKHMSPPIYDLLLCCE